jgi:hypothetical protein
MRRRDSVEGVKSLPQLIYLLVGNTDLAGDLQRLYACPQIGFDGVAHRVVISRRHDGGERV